MDTTIDTTMDTTIDTTMDTTMDTTIDTTIDTTNNITKHIDRCIFNSSHYDIACIIYMYLKDKHRYIKNNTWEYLNSLNEWIVDVNNQQIIYSIRTIVCSAFTERSLYWANIKTDPKYQDTEVISNKLLIISSKLKDNKYISMLIKECKQFFII